MAAPWYKWGSRFCCSAFSSKKWKCQLNCASWLTDMTFNTLRLLSWSGSWNYRKHVNKHLWQKVHCTLYRSIKIYFGIKQHLHIQNPISNGCTCNYNSADSLANFDTKTFWKNPSKLKCNSSYPTERYSAHHQSLFAKIWKLLMVLLSLCNVDHSPSGEIFLHRLIIID